jgi:hypothetical protein
MQVLRTAVSTGRRLSVAVLQAIVLAAIVVAILIAVATVSRSAPFGAGNTLARGNAAITVPDGAFADSTTATVNPGGGTWVYAACSQGGKVVYAQYVQADANNHAVLSLGPTPNWTGGSASCIAQEGSWGNNGRWHVLASTTFAASE